MNQLQTASPTSCKDCVFQVRNDKKQIGCYGQDISLEELIDYDSSNFIFKRKICQFKRTKDWTGYKGEVEKMWEEARKECTIQYTAISIVDRAEDANTFYEAASRQSLPPRSVFLAFHNHDEYKLWNSMKKDGAIRWQSFRFYEPNQIYGILVNSSQTNLVWFSQPDPIINDNYFENLDRQINDEGFRFFLLSDDDYNNYIASKTLYLMQNQPFYYFIRELKRHDIISREQRPSASQSSCSCECDGDTTSCCAGENVGSCQS